MGGGAAGAGRMGASFERSRKFPSGKVLISHMRTG